MTFDDLIKLFFGILLTALSTVVGWIANTVIASRDRILTLEGEVKRLQEKVNHLESNQVTGDKIREAIEQALDRRDKAYDAKRADWDKLRKLEIKEAIREELDAMVPRLICPAHPDKLAGGTQK